MKVMEATAPPRSKGLTREAWRWIIVSVGLFPPPRPCRRGQTLDGHEGLLALRLLLREGPNGNETAGKDSATL